MEPRLTKRQAAIIGLYTGITAGPFADVQELAEELMARPVFTHEMPRLREILEAKAKPLFLAICHERPDEDE